MASWATRAFFLLSASLEDNLRCSSWDCKLSSSSLAGAAELCPSPISTNCLWVLCFLQTLLYCKVAGTRKTKLFLGELDWEFWGSASNSNYLQSLTYVVNRKMYWCCKVCSLWLNIMLCPTFRSLVRYNYTASSDRVSTCWKAFTNNTFDITL